MLYLLVCHANAFVTGPLCCFCSRLTVAQGCETMRLLLEFGDPFHAREQDQRRSRSFSTVGELFDAKLR